MHAFGESHDAGSVRSTISEKVFKLVLVGNRCVGKTAIITRFLDDEFKSDGVRTYGKID